MSKDQAESVNIAHDVVEKDLYKRRSLYKNTKFTHITADNFYGIPQRGIRVLTATN